MVLKCDICGHTSKGRSDYVIHYRVHTGEKPFRCTARIGGSDCGKRFATKSQLKVHGRTHSGERPYSCSYCVARFSTSGHLAIHVLSHTGERPFQCDFPGCGKRFAQRGNLTRHSRAHTGERPYECRSCGARFSDKGNLTKHSRKHDATQKARVPGWLAESGLDGAPQSPQSPQSDLPALRVLCMAVSNQLANVSGVASISSDSVPHSVPAALNHASNCDSRLKSVQSGTSLRPRQAPSFCTRIFRA